MTVLTFRWPSRIPAAPLAIVIGVAVGALLILASGGNPLTAYWAILRGALAPANLPDTLNWAVPMVGMALVAALPLRAGLLNLGGDGQLAIGGLVAALTPLYLPAPGPIAAAVAIVAAMLASRPNIVTMRKSPCRLIATASRSIS
jgi:general nucleoside transport system permease protein